MRTASRIGDATHSDRGQFPVLSAESLAALLCKARFSNLRARDRFASSSGIVTRHSLGRASVDPEKCLSRSSKPNHQKRSWSRDDCSTSAGNPSSRARSNQSSRMRLLARLLCDKSDMAFSSMMRHQEADRVGRMAYEADVFLGGISYRPLIKVSSRVRLSALEHFLTTECF